MIKFIKFLLSLKMAVNSILVVSILFEILNDFLCIRFHIFKRFFFLLDVLQFLDCGLFFPREFFRLCLYKYLLSFHLFLCDRLGNDSSILRISEGRHFNLDDRHINLLSDCFKGRLHLVQAYVITME